MIRKTTILVASSLAALMLAGCASTTAPSSAPTVAATQSAVASVAPDFPSTEPIAVDPATAMSDWYSAGPGDDIEALVSDLGDVQTATGDSDVSSLIHACEAMTDDIAAFQAEPASPDDRMSALFDRAMTDYAASAAACIAGDLNAAGDEMESGNTAIGLASERLTVIQNG